MHMMMRVFFCCCFTQNGGGGAQDEDLLPHSMRLGHHDSCFVDTGVCQNIATGVFNTNARFTSLSRATKTAGGSRM